jgi:hypothetical protein
MPVYRPLGSVLYHMMHHTLTVARIDEAVRTEKHGH